jgi:hypothetical protein
MEKLMYFYGSFEQETPLLQYEIMKIAELINSTKEERGDCAIKVESHRIVS